MKKLLFSILFIAGGLLLYLTANPQIVLAQTQSAQVNNGANSQENQPQPINPQALPLNTNPDVPHNLSTYSQSVFIELLGTASCFLGGQNIIYREEKCLGIDPQTKKIGYVENSQGLVGVVGGMIGYTVEIPVSSTYFAHNTLSNFGITKSAIAQTPTGSGFDGLRPVLQLWTTMRNLVYLLFVFIFIVLGLGIMFRIQIDPRAVMTIQGQLPKIVITLILITFSYAIAGFLIDLMYLSMYLVVDIFRSQGMNLSTSLPTNPLNAAGGLGGISGISFDASTSIASVFSGLFEGSIFGQLIKGLLSAIVTGLVGTVMFGPIGGIAAGAVGGIAGLFGMGIPGIGDPFTIVITAIAWLIIVIAVLSALLKLWFILIKTYIFTLINVIFAPFFIVFGLFPGSSFSFSTWFRSIVSNLAAFPTVLVLFSIGKTIQDGFSSGAGFVPPYVGGVAENPSAFGGIIGLGVILLAPEAVNMVKSVLKAPEFKYSSAIGRSIGTGTSFISKPVGGLWGSLFGEDMHGNPKPLTQWAQKRLGRPGSVLFGGGWMPPKAGPINTSPWTTRKGRGLAGVIGNRFRKGQNNPPEQVAEAQQEDKPEA